MSSPPPIPATAQRSGWQRFAATVVRLFHEYANWLVSITWKRFLLLAVLLMVLAAMLQHLPPFSWSWVEEIEGPAIPSVQMPKIPPIPPIPKIRIEKPAKGSGDSDVSISIDKNGIRIAPRSASAASAAASAASAAASAASGSGASGTASSSGGDSTPSISIDISGLSKEQIKEAARAARDAAREAAAEAREQAQQAAEDARDQAEEARQQAEEARQEAQQAIEEAQRDIRQAAKEAERANRRSKRIVRFGDSLTDLAFLWIIASALLKITYKGRLQAEVKAAAATETAESEQLKRQVVEARMAAMQAQVEPHFLFNTLASIDHLIETDPKRASQMQKNLIALLRASMPAMREAHPMAHNLGREMAVIKPYLEILKVRMEDRLRTEIDVPDGLLSADFPTMMIQSLVENAIKHGLEPKAEGGMLKVKAEIVHGNLAVTVADTGLGFGKAATAGTGVGLANIRERLQLLYGNKGTMTIAENQPSGTVVTITVPYQAQAREGENA